MLKFSGSSEPTSDLGRETWPKLRTQESRPVHQSKGAAFLRERTYASGIGRSQGTRHSSKSDRHQMLRGRLPPAHVHDLRSLKVGADTDLPPEVRRRRMRSKIQWFTEVCKSHCIAHFAASFIVVRTNAFVAGSHQAESIQAARAAWTCTVPLGSDCYIPKERVWISCE